MENKNNERRAMYNEKITRRVILLIFILFSSPTLLPSQLASPVIDVSNNITGAVIKTVETVSRTIREDILPFKENISKVQNFFKDAKKVVNVVVKNLEMTKQLIEMEDKISELFLTSLEQVDKAENIPYKWKHRWRLAQLWYQSRELLEVFDLAYLNEKGIMDDEQRITLIKETLDKVRKVYSAMKVSVRRTQKLEREIQRKKRELAAFEEFFTNR